MIGKFCRECGTKLVPKELENEGVVPYCPECGQFRFPQYNVAVSMIVVNEEKDEILLIKQYGRPTYILVAGYVTQGESLEDAVRREIREEASIEVKDIRYFGSQTWPFPSNIMIGFRAEYASGELKPDGEEVVESGWFDRDNLLEISRPGSIARRMLDEWVSTRI